LTLEDVAARLAVPFNTRAMKRLIRKHQIAYLRIGVAWRLTEEQFAELREALTHSPPGTRDQVVRSTYKAAVLSGKGASEALQASVKEALQKHARRGRH
jgi:hypothetical protein